MSKEVVVVVVVVVKSNLGSDQQVSSSLLPFRKDPVRVFKLWSNHLERRRWASCLFQVDLCEASQTDTRCCCCCCDWCSTDADPVSDLAIYTRTDAEKTLGWPQADDDDDDDGDGNIFGDEERENNPFPLSLFSSSANGSPSHFFRFILCMRQSAGRAAPLRHVARHVCVRRYASHLLAGGQMLRQKIKMMLLPLPFGRVATRSGEARATALPFSLLYTHTHSLSLSLSLSLPLSL
jgi:hypothetical protein